MVNIYNTFDSITTSKLSGGKPHFTYRSLSIPVKIYEYQMNYGDNYHSLAQAVFGSDTYWWVLQDINNLRDSFDFKVGDKVKLPEELVKTGINKKFFF